MEIEHKTKSKKGMEPLVRILDGYEGIRKRGWTSCEKLNEVTENCCQNHDNQNDRDISSKPPPLTI